MLYTSNLHKNENDDIRDGNQMLEKRTNNQKEEYLRKLYFFLIL